LTAVWHILSKNEPYNAELYHKADKPPKNRELTSEQAFALLLKQGYSISDREVAAGLYALDNIPFFDFIKSLMSLLSLSTVHQVC